MNDMDALARRSVEGFGGLRRPGAGAAGGPAAQPPATNVAHGYVMDAAGIIRPMTGFLNTLSPAQQEAAPDYDALIDLAQQRFPIVHAVLAVDERRGPYIATYTGRFHPFDPQPQDVRIDDIAHSLSSLVRYTGHGGQRYSVAEHSVHIARWLRGAGYDIDTQLAGLMHDAPEALSGFGDVARPSKSRAPIIKETEDAIYRLAIAPAFGLSPDIPDAVHEADMRICADEMAQNMREVDPNVGPPLGISVCFWSQAVAEGTFMQVFRGLMDERLWGMPGRVAA